MGRPRKRLNSIHDPPDPSPRKLPPEAQTLWDEAHAEAMRIYGKDDLAQRAAWREVKLGWKQTGRKTWQRCRDGLCKPWPLPQILPRPQEILIPLGVLIEYTYVTPRGELRVKTTRANHPPILYWDDTLKALFAYPKLPYPSQCKPIPKGTRDGDRAVALYRKWHQRDPQCFDDSVTITPVTLKAVGAGDTVSYRSDKWHEAEEDPRVLNAQEYIHNHWYDVFMWVDDERNPSAIMIEGGELDMHARGIIH